MARLAGRAVPRARPVRRAGRRVRALRPARNGRLEPGAGGLPAQLRRGQLPRPRHDASEGDPAAAGVDRRRAHVLRRLLQVGDDARDALASRALLGGGGPEPGAVRGRHRSRLRARGARAGARVPRGLPRRAIDRWPLLGALGLRARRRRADRRRRRPHPDARARDGAGVPRRAGQPGPPARSPVRGGLAGRTRQDLHRGHDRRVRPLGRAADRGIHRQGGQGARPCARRVAGRARSPASRGASRRSVRPRRRVLPLGVRDRGRRLDPRDQRLQPAGRPVRQGPDEPDPRQRPRSGRRAAGSLDELLDGAEERDYVCVQAFVDPTDENEARIMELVQTHPRPHRLRDHARVRAALPALHRPAAQGRPSDRPLRPGRRRHRRRDPDPRQGLRLRQADLRPGGRRLRLAAGARPSHRSNRDWRTSRCNSEWWGWGAWARA